MAATDIGTLFLDIDLRIRRFTPPISNFFSITPNDLGRSIGDFRTSLDYNLLEEDARQVLSQLIPIERLSRSQRDSKVYLVRLRPYRTIRNLIDEVVVTFVDVTEQKKAEDALRASQEQLAQELSAIQRLHEMSMRVVTARTMPEALDQILDAAVDIQSTDLGIMHLQNPEHTLDIFAHRGFAQDSLGTLEELDKHAGSACRQVLHSGRRLVLKEIGAEPDRSVAAKIGYRAMQATPLINQSGEILGVLSTYYRDPHLLSLRDEHLLDLLGRHAANLLDRLHTEYSLKKMNEELLQRSKDLTQNEIKLNQQTEQLRENDRRKTDFLAMLGHELRNPLAAIRNSISLLTNAPANGTSPKPDHSVSSLALSILERQARLMTRLVNDLLDVARINENKIELVRNPVALSDSIQAVIAALGTEIEAKQLKFTTKLPEEPLYLDVDNERFLQILDNLLGNAVKFTHAGGKIEVTATQEGHNALIRIKDNGIGIHTDFIGRIFDQFTHGHSPNPVGLGLGLSLVSKLVTMHGGTITAYSEGPGKGSEFALRLPLSKSTANNTADIDTHPTGTFRMLVVDDSADVADGLAMLLRTQAHQVEVAYDGEAAYNAACRLHPQVAFVDLSMPDTDGYQLAKRLRDKFPPSALTLIAVSGHIEDARAHDAGFDHYLLKPVSVAIINKILTSLA